MCVLDFFNNIHKEYKEEKYTVLKIADKHEVLQERGQ